MSGKTSSTSIWLKFFRGAGIPSGIDTKYALAFDENRVKMDMLMDLNKEYLKDMGIVAMGDIIAILKHAKKTHDENKEQAVEPHKPSQSQHSSSPDPAAKVPVAASSSSSNESSSRSSRSQSSHSESLRTEIKASSASSSQTHRNPQVTKSVALVSTARATERVIQVKNQIGERNSPSSQSKEAGPRKMILLNKRSSDVILKEEVPVQKKIRVLPEQEGKYTIKMPEGTTAKTKKIIQGRLGPGPTSLSLKPVEKKTVFDRLGDSSVSSSTTAPTEETRVPTDTLESTKAPKSVFARLGGRGKPPESTVTTASVSSPPSLLNLQIGVQQQVSSLKSRLDTKTHQEKTLKTIPSRISIPYLTNRAKLKSEVSAPESSQQPSSSSTSRYISSKVTASSSAPLNEGTQKCRAKSEQQIDRQGSLKVQKKEKTVVVSEVTIPKHIKQGQLSGDTKQRNMSSQTCKKSPPSIRKSLKNPKSSAATQKDLLDYTPKRNRTRSRSPNRNGKIPSVRRRRSVNSCSPDAYHPAHVLMNTIPAKSARRRKKDRSPTPERVYRTKLWPIDKTDYPKKEKCKSHSKAGSPTRHHVTCKPTQPPVETQTEKLPVSFQIKSKALNHTSVISTAPVIWPIDKTDYPKKEKCRSHSKAGSPTRHHVTCKPTQPPVETQTEKLPVSFQIKRKALNHTSVISTAPVIVEQPSEIEKKVPYHPSIDPHVPIMEEKYLKKNYIIFNDKFQQASTPDWHHLSQVKLDSSNQQFEDTFGFNEYDWGVKEGCPQLSSTSKSTDFVNRVRQNQIPCFGHSAVVTFPLVNPPSPCKILRDRRDGFVATTSQFSYSNTFVKESNNAEDDSGEDIIRITRPPDERNEFVPSKSTVSMMAKMGWSPGYGLGKHKQGRKAAIPTGIRSLERTVSRGAEGSYLSTSSRLRRSVDNDFVRHADRRAGNSSKDSSSFERRIEDIIRSPAPRPVDGQVLQTVRMPSQNKGKVIVKKLIYKKIPKSAPQDDIVHLPDIDDPLAAYYDDD